MRPTQEPQTFTESRVAVAGAPGRCEQPGAASRRELLKAGLTLAFSGAVIDSWRPAVAIPMNLSQQSPAGEFPPPLRVDGRHLKDPSGRGVILRGVNKAGFVDCPDGLWDPPTGPLFSGIGRWNPDVVCWTLDEIRKWGCNVVRLHTCVQWWKENPSTYRDPYRDVKYPKPYRQMVKDTIRWAGERGVYVIFDFYNVNAKGGQDTLPWPPHVEGASAVGSRQEFLDLWKNVAKELGGFPHVLLELYNEPHGDRKQETEWFNFVQQAIGALRPLTENVLVVQWDYGCWVNLDYPPPGNRAGTLDWVEKFPLEGKNILYSTHLYRTSGGGGGGMVHRSKGGLTKCWQR